MLFFSCFSKLLSVAAVALKWVEFFSSVKLQNGFVDLKMSPDYTGTVFSFGWFGVNYSFNHFREWERVIRSCADVQRKERPSLFSLLPAGKVGSTSVLAHAVFVASICEAWVQVVLLMLMSFWQSRCPGRKYGIILLTEETYKTGLLNTKRPVC